MKKSTFLGAFLILISVSFMLNAQSNNRRFKMEGINQRVIEMNQVFTSSEEIFPFDKNGQRIFGLAVTANIELEDHESVVRILFVDRNFEEHLVYESYALLDAISPLEVDDLAEETAVLNGLQAWSLKIEIHKARVELAHLTYSTQMGQGRNVAELKREKKREQNLDKINRLNKNLQEKRLGWVAGPTEVSEMSYSERQKLYGQSTFPAGFEFYAGGVISTGSESTDDMSLKSASSSMYVDNWDWRDRHGVNWMTPVVRQGSCGSCWSFAAVGATEALVNLFFNQQLNLDLSEQDVLSCSGGGNCSGGFPSTALNYITNTGVVDEKAFPYSGTTEPCSNKSSTPAERIKIGGKVDFGSKAYPQTEDVLKKMLIELGPVSGGLYDWSHAMTLAGYQVVKEGDTFFYRDLNLKRYWKTIETGDPLIGKTVWIFKNSWGTSFGDEGYVYVETPITNFRWTHGLKTPVVSLVNDYEVICEDKDGDGYYWWGLGEKPEDCDCPDEPDGDDSDPTLGPIDQYGNFMLLNSPPVADFSADNSQVNEGESVAFSDQSTDNPVSWAWVFEGGNPATSSQKNPEVKYALPGSYGVSLTVSNSNGTSTKKVENFMTVQEYIPVYCSSAGSASDEWIASVTINGQTVNSGSSGSAGYQDFTAAETFAADAGTEVNFSLNPGFLRRARDVYWRIWIDYNGDMDFNDPGELVFTSAPTTNIVSGSFTVPAELLLTTRMRIAMKRGYAPSACELFIQGEVKDYSIQFREAVALPPVADFVAAENYITAGESVQFTDLSANEPDQWQWNFPGGIPEYSSERNPVVKYSAPGEYDVVLKVSREGFSASEKIRQKYITTVEEVHADYCTPVAVNSSSDFILNVTIGNALNNTSGGSGYMLFSDPVILNPGESYDVSLSPKISSNRNFWRIWIDFNGDGDFNGSDETLVSINNKKGTVNTSLTIPAYATGSTRMRVTMRNNSSPSSCDDNFSGETEDYVVSFATAAPSVESSKESITGIGGFNAPDGIRLYPNPAGQELTLLLASPAQGDSYSIYTVNGGKVMRDLILSETTRINLSGLPAGVYVVVVENNNRIYRERIVKKQE